MDTDIDNYNIEDLYKIYKISDPKKIDINTLYNKTFTILKKLSNNNDVQENERNNLRSFFYSSFYKICDIHKLNIEDFMSKNLHINSEGANIFSEKIQKSIDNISKPDEMENPYNKKIVESKDYPGSLPEQLSHTYSINTNNDKYVRGLLNPLKRETVKNIFTISSKFRDNLKSSTTDFTIDINNIYHNVISLKLASVELMNSYYPFSQYLNTNSFTINTYLFDSNNTISNYYSKEIIISEGIHNTTSITQDINDIFLADTSLLFVECDYNFQKGKIYFYINPTAPPPPPGFSYGFDLDFTINNDPQRPLYLNMGWLLGYRKPLYLFFKDYVNTSTTVLEIGFNPEAPADFTGTKFFLLEIDDYNKNNPEVFKYNLDSKTSFNVNNIIAKIPNTSNTFSIIFEDSSDRVFKNRKYFGPVRISKLHIRLLDENGRVINLNNSEIIISLEIETLEVPYKNMIYQ